MYHLELSPQAEADVKRLYDFIAIYRPDAAKKAVDAIINTAQQLKLFPQMGNLIDNAYNLRELPVSFGSRGYVIRYCIDQHQVIILRIWHSKEYRHD